MKELKLFLNRFFSYHFPEKMQKEKTYWITKHLLLMILKFETKVLEQIYFHLGQNERNYLKKQNKLL